MNSINPSAPATSCQSFPTGIMVQVVVVMEMIIIKMLMVKWETLHLNKLLELRENEKNSTWRRQQEKSSHH
ncbi:unnamed protein product [Lupinus luteus]|uniref:Uncharacterized protein n=1 Tax=Lupinus luteus TaxID=3873 RepID=A0AAV1VVQ3_LUPLU